MALLFLFLCACGSVSSSHHSAGSRGPAAGFNISGSMAPAERACRAWHSGECGTLVVLSGAEIADECSFYIILNNNGYFDPSNVILNDKPYAIQPEYDNLRHACTTAP
jgi:hypothetical protein